MSLLTYLCCSGGTLGFETEIDAGARVPSCDFPFGFAAAALPLTFVSSPFDEIRARSAVLVCSVVVVALGAVVVVVGSVVAVSLGVVEGTVVAGIVVTTRAALAAYPTKSADVAHEPKKIAWVTWRMRAKPLSRCWGVR